MKLEGLEAVRKKPGMYIGGTDERALSNCVSELIDNSVEHHLAGSCSSIIVTVHGDGSVSVRDDGPGISVTVDAGEEISYVEMAFTTLLMPGHQPKPPYRVGPDGVGAKCVNAVSEWMAVTTVSNGEEFQIAFARGKVKEPLRKCSEPNSKRGTTIRFRPDPEIFGDKTFDSNALTRNLEQIAMLHPGLDLWFVDERPNSANRALVSHFLFPNGSADYLNLILPNEMRIHSGEPVQISGEEAGVKVNVAFQFTESINTWILSFVNSCELIRGGTHVAGFLRGLTDAVNQFVGQRRRFEPHEVRIGLSAIVSVWLANPMYARATRSELINPQAEEVVRKLTFEKVRAWIAEIQGSDDWFIERLDEQRSPGFGLGED
jgi:Type IIA topoisomerase (DNA gyrase/topo II, topoisomerase IV), B subunit